MTAESFPEPDLTPEQELEIEKLVDKRGISYEMATVAVTGSVSVVRLQEAPSTQEAIITPMKKKKRKGGNSQYKNLKYGNTLYDNDSYYTDYALPGQRKYIPSATIVHPEPSPVLEVTSSESTPAVQQEPSQEPPKDIPQMLDIFDLPEN